MPSFPTSITAQTHVIPGEDPCQLEALAAEYHSQFQPSGPLERFLTDALVYADWQLRRLRKVEAQIWSHETADAKPYFLGLNGEALQHSTERSYYRALNQLQRLQAAARPAAPVPKLGSFRQVTDPPQQAPDALRARRVLPFEPRLI